MVMKMFEKMMVNRLPVILTRDGMIVALEKVVYVHPNGSGLYFLKCDGCEEIAISKNDYEDISEQLFDDDDELEDSDHA